LSEDGTGAPEGYADVPVSGLNSFLRRLPDSYIVKGEMEPQDEYIDIVPGSVYGMSLDYEFIAPLSFGPDFRLQITEDIHNLNVDIQEVTVSKVIVKLDAVNAVPLAFMLEAQAIDAEGNVIESISAAIDKTIVAGTLDSPSVNPVQITFTAQGKLSFEGIRLTVTADSPAEAPLNDNQYFMFDNISLHLPEGITYHN
jgi:citrate lyase gamma subunit